MKAGKITAKIRDMVKVCLMVDGEEVMRYKNIELPDTLKELEIRDFGFNVLTDGKIEFHLHFDKDVLPTEWPDCKARRYRTPKTDTAAMLKADALETPEAPEAIESAAEPLEAPEAPEELAATVAADTAIAAPKFSSAGSSALTRCTTAIPPTV